MHMAQSKGEDRHAVPATALTRAADAILPCRAEDIDEVAQLFQHIFRKEQRVPASLSTYLETLFLRHPWFDEAMPSWVYRDPCGKVGGFIGVLPGRMIFGDRSVTVALAGSLMVADPKAHPLAGARLVRAYLNGPQDLSVTESANPISMGMFEKLGLPMQVAYGMDWMRVLRPAGFGAALLARLHGALRVTRPLARGLDRLAEGLSVTPFRPDLTPHAGMTGDDASTETLIEVLPQLAAHCALRPDWDAASLGWLLAHADRKAAHGDAARRVVRDKRGRTVGAYLYYGRKGGIGWVLQVLSTPKTAGAVIDDLFADAYARGCVALKGRSQPLINEALLRRGTPFFSRSATVASSHDPELMQAIRCGDALITGLAGETWNRLIGDRFED